MQFTNDVYILKKIIIKSCPTASQIDQRASIYLQDVTACVDYYVFGIDYVSGYIFALIDALENRYYLDYEFINLGELRNHNLYYKVYRKNKKPLHDDLFKEISKIKSL